MRHIDDRRRNLGILAFCAVLAGCDAADSLREGFAHSQAVQADLERSIGLKSLVGFDWNNGSLSRVSVTFQGLPMTHPLSEIADSTRFAVRKEFKQEPKEIVVSFSISP